MHCNTQVSDDLLRQMGSVDYEAVQRDLTLLMTDSQVVITLQSGRKHQDDQNHGGGDIVTLSPGIMASRLWSLRASYGEACLAQLGLLQVIFIMMLIIENA